MTQLKKIALLVDKTEEAQARADEIKHTVTPVSPEQADAFVVLGGDGFMLECLHYHIDRRLPVYGMNCGSVGFLLNRCSSESLLVRINSANETRLYPLKMTALKTNGKRVESLAFNEVSLLRETRQAANIKITIDGVQRLEELVCDGVLVSTPAGSTAYNMSAYGPIIPIDAKLLALTPISAFRPRRWRGALLPHSAKVQFDIINPEKRPVSAVADFTEIRDIKRVNIFEDRSKHVCLLFDQEHDLEERFIQEQFVGL